MVSRSEGQENSLASKADQRKFKTVQSLDIKTF